MQPPLARHVRLWDIAAGGRPEVVVLLVSPSRSKPQRAVDALLGVSRRRRQVAYLAILGGVRALRPILWRVAAVATVVAVVVRMT